MTDAESNRDVADPRLRRGLLSVAAARGVAALAGFAIPVAATRLLNPADVGTLFLIFAVLAVLTTVASGGIPEAGLREIAGSIGAQDPRRAQGEVSQTLGLGALLASVSAFGYAVVGARVVGRVFDNVPITDAAAAVAIWLGASVMARHLAFVLKAQSRFAWSEALLDFSSGGLVVRSLFLGALAALLWRSNATSLSAVLSIGAGAALLAVATGGRLVHSRYGSEPRSDRDHKTSVRTLMAVGWPIMATGLAAVAGQQADLMVIGILGVEADVAQYGAAVRLTALIGLPLVVANGVVPTLIAGYVRKGRIAALEVTLRSASTAATVVALLAVLAVVLFDAALLGAAFGPFYREAAPLLTWLSLGTFASVLTGPCGQVLMLSGHERALLVITAVTITLGIGASVFAMTIWGAVGVAGATAIFRGIHNFSMAFWVRRRLGIITWAYVAPASVFGALRWLLRERESGVQS